MLISSPETCTTKPNLLTRKNNFFLYHQTTINPFTKKKENVFTVTTLKNVNPFKYVSLHHPWHMNENDYIDVSFIKDSTISPQDFDLFKEESKKAIETAQHFNHTIQKFKTNHSMTNTEKTFQQNTVTTQL